MPYTVIFYIFINYRLVRFSYLCYISGFPDGPAVTAVVGSYLEQGQSNVALLNWEELAAPVLPSMFNSYVNWAAPNARKVSILF